MRNGYRTVSAVAVLALAAWRSTAEPLAAPLTGAITQEAFSATSDPDELVRFVYRRAQHLARKSGSDLRLEVLGLRTVGADAFVAVPATELLGEPMSQDFVLDPGITRVGQDIAEPLVRPFWKKAPKVDAAMAAELGNLSLGRLLRRLRARDSYWRGVDAVTLGRIRVTLEGRTREYPIGAFWFGSAKNGFTKFSLQDNAIPRLERVLVWGEAGSPPPLPLAATASCVPTPRAEFLNPRMSSPANDVEHNTGWHGSSFQMGGYCQVSASCTSSCIPAISENECEEFGDIKGPGSHRAYVDAQVFPNTAINAVSTCHATNACAVESCAFLICHGVSITVGPTGAQFGGASPVWKATLTDQRTCPAPLPMPARNPKAPPLPTLQPPYPPRDGSGHWVLGFGPPQPGNCDFVCVDIWDPQGRRLGEWCWLVCN